MLKIGIDSIDNAKGDALIGPLENIIVFLLLKCARIALTVINPFKTVSKGVSESGCETPSRRLHSFIKNPINIKNAILNPAEKAIVSQMLSWFNLSNRMIIKPGIKVK